MSVHERVLRYVELTLDSHRSAAEFDRAKAVRRLGNVEDRAAFAEWCRA